MIRGYIISTICACGGRWEYVYGTWYRCRVCGKWKSWVPKAGDHHA